MSSREEYHWAYAALDYSNVSTIVTSVLMIVYSSFRSLNMEEKAREKEKEKKINEQSDGLSPGLAGNDQRKLQDIRTFTTTHALLFPVISSISLLIVFYFFDSLQLLYAIVVPIFAAFALAFLLLPMCQYIIRPCSDGNKISFGICGRFTGAELLSFSLAVFLVCIWVMTGHWILMDAMGIGLAVAVMVFVRLPSLKVSTLLLTGLLIYDVFWVYFSSYIFNSNVMLKVATKAAENPVGMVARHLNLGGVAKDAPKLDLPGKLVFPSIKRGTVTVLGLGDIIIPGLLLCFVLRYDAYKKSHLGLPGDFGPPPLKKRRKITYFHCSLLGYFLGLITTSVCTDVFKHSQPALLYLVPFTLLPLFTMAYLKGDLRRMWSEPFISYPLDDELEI